MRARLHPHAEENLVEEIASNNHVPNGIEICIPRSDVVCRTRTIDTQLLSMEPLTRRRALRRIGSQAQSHPCP